MYGGRAHASTTELVEGTLKDKHIKMLNLAHAWIDQLLPHVLSKVRASRARHGKARSYQFALFHVIITVLLPCACPGQPRQLRPPISRTAARRRRPAHVAPAARRALLGQGRALRGIRVRKPRHSHRLHDPCIPVRGHALDRLPARAYRADRSARAAVRARRGAPGKRHLHTLGAPRGRPCARHEARRRRRAGAASS